MSSVTALPQRLKQGSPVVTAWCGIPEPAIAGILAREAYDAVTLDMQHGTYDLAAVARAIPLIAAAGKPAMARIPVGEFQTASKLLDAGVSGIIAPMINTVEDARRFASFMKWRRPHELPHALLHGQPESSRHRGVLEALRPDAERD